MKFEQKMRKMGLSNHDTDFGLLLGMGNYDIIVNLDNYCNKNELNPNFVLSKKTFKGLPEFLKKMNDNLDWFCKNYIKDEKAYFKDNCDGELETDGTPVEFDEELYKKRLDYFKNYIKNASEFILAFFEE